MVSNIRRQEWSRILLRYCWKCGKIQSWRATECPDCGNKDTEVYWRIASLEGSNLFTDPEEEYLEKLERDQTVARLQGVDRKIATDLLIGRMIFDDNHVQYLANKYGVSRKTITRAKKKIVQEMSRQNPERNVLG